MAQNNDRIIHTPMELKGFSKYLSLLFHRLTENAIWTFCELGIADLMAEHKLPITALELSQLNGNNWNAEFLYRLLRVNADAGIVTQVNTNNENLTQPEQTIQFQLTEDGLLLTSNHPSKVSYIVQLLLNPNMGRTYQYLPSIIKDGFKNGNCFEQTFGCDIFEYMKKEENKDYAKTFNNAMVAHVNYTASSIKSAVDFSRFNILVDIGGGLGTLLSSIMEKYQNLHGVLFDLDHVVKSAKDMNPNEFQQKNIETTRYEFVSGDMFKSETIPSADAYILKSIIHDWDDEKSIEILKSIRNANKSKTEKSITVFLVEAVIMSENKENWEAHVMDLHMLAIHNSKERSLSGYSHILSKSGYEIKHLHKTEGLTSIIEATTTTTTVST